MYYKVGFRILIVKVESQNGLDYGSHKMNYKEGVLNGLQRGSPKKRLYRGSPKWFVQGMFQNGLNRGSPKIDCTGDVPK